MARALGIALPISLKHSIEICDFIRGKKLQTAKKILEDVIAKKRAIPFKRFTEGSGHKKGISSGKYPVKASREILKLLNSVEANAKDKNLDVDDLVIIHIVAKKGYSRMRYGRRPWREAKSTHIEVYVKEERNKKQEKEIKKEIKKQKEIKTSKGKKEEKKND